MDDVLHVYSNEIRSLAVKVNMEVLSSQPKRIGYGIFEK